MTKVAASKKRFSPFPAEHRYVLFSHTVIPDRMASNAGSWSEYTFFVYNIETEPLEVFRPAGK